MTITVHSITIDTDEKASKSYSFTAALLAWVVADHLWSSGSSENTRPVWALIAASDQEATPFMQNLRLGRKATVKGPSVRHDGVKFEWMKSAEYAIPSPQKYASVADDGVKFAMFSPTLRNIFAIDPGPVTGSVSFITMPDAKRVHAETSSLATVANRMRDHVRGLGYEEFSERELDELPAMALLFCAQMLTRSTAPIPTDPEFQAQVFAACLGAGLAAYPYVSSWDRQFGRSTKAFQAVGLDQCGYAQPVAMCATHAALKELLSREILEYDRRRPL